MRSFVFSDRVAMERTARSRMSRSRLSNEAMLGRVFEGVDGREGCRLRPHRSASDPVTSRREVSRRDQVVAIVADGALGETEFSGDKVEGMTRKSEDENFSIAPTGDAIRPERSILHRRLLGTRSPFGEGATLPKSLTHLAL